MVGLVALLPLALTGAAPLPAPALQAHAVLARHCAACHDGTTDKRSRGGLGFVLDLRRLVSRGQIAPGLPDASPLLKRIATGEMPPGKHSFTGRDLDILRDWVKRGAPGLGPTATVVRSEEVWEQALADLRRVETRERQYMRYLSLGHLGTDEAAAELRHAVAKLVNSLSWHPRLTPPQEVGPVLLRLDLRDYRWTARLWDKLGSVSPYRGRGAGSPVLREIAALTGAEEPILRADWFVATASRPPFYHDFLGLPLTDKGLERLAGVDLATAGREDRVYRAGFNRSGVARANRVLERVDGRQGAYWRSHDFGSNTGRENVFGHPLDFRAAGGEIIFHLPNGLQGYLIVDADGQRIDKAPGEVVQDPSRPDRLVENGLSCIGCHAGGIIPKEDEVRSHVLAHRKAFDADVVETVLARYVPRDRLRRRIDEDNARFRRALGQLGLSDTGREPVLAAVRRYEAVLGREELAAELDTDEAGLTRLLAAVPELARALAASKGGTVQRELAEELYPRLVEARGASATAPGKRHEGHKGPVRAVALRAGWLLTGGNDGQVLVRRAEGGPVRQLASLPGPVEAVALSADAKRAAVVLGREVFVHDVATGRRVCHLRGHTAEVRAVAFLSADRLVSAGEDRTARVWDIGAGREVGVMVGHRGAVTCVTIGEAGKFVVTGSTDRTVRWWDQKGREVGQRVAPAEVHAVAWHTGTLAVGTSRGEVLVWDTRRAKAAQTYKGPEGTIRAVRLTDAGDIEAVASRGAVLWRWRGATVWNSKDTGRTQAATFATDGTVAVAGDEVRTLPPRGSVRP